MKDRILEIRKILPVPMGEAMQLLKENNGDVQQCITVFKAKSIAQICEQTGCDKAMAEKYYTEEKYDLNRAMSFAREAMYDQNYVPIEGLTKEALRIVMQWIAIIEQKDFPTSLSFVGINEVVRTLSMIPVLSNISPLVEKAKIALDTIFESYSDDMPIEEFVRRHKRLDDEKDFQIALETVPLKLTVMKDELLRHIRNL